MIQITATDLKARLGKYLSLVDREEIRITKNGAEIAVLTAPKEKHSWVDDLIGIIPNADTDAKKIKAERLAQKHEGID
jgi:prevent-host-death family protein